MNAQIWAPFIDNTPRQSAPLPLELINILTCQAASNLETTPLVRIIGKKRPENYIHVTPLTQNKVLSIKPWSGEVGGWLVGMEAMK